MFKSTISYESKHKLSITDDQKRLLSSLRQLNNFFTSDTADTNIDVDDKTDWYAETRYNCYFCHSLCREKDYITIIYATKNSKYVCTCANIVCVRQFSIFKNLVENVQRLSHISLPICTINNSNNMYLSVDHRHSINLVFDKVNGLIVFATTVRFIGEEYVPKSDDDHFIQMFKCSNILDYYCDDFFPLQLKRVFSDC